jgi:hypothetical protein
LPEHIGSENEPLDIYPAIPDDREQRSNIAGSALQGSGPVLRRTRGSSLRVYREIEKADSGRGARISGFLFGSENREFHTTIKGGSRPADTVRDIPARSLLRAASARFPREPVSPVDCA